MAAVSLKEAASLAGMKSRSTFYRLMEEGRLNRSNFLRGGPRAWRIELEPEGQAPFLEWLPVQLGPQGPHRRSEPPEPPPADPWAHVPERLRSVDGGEPFWQRFGRIAPNEALTDEEYWATVAKIVKGMCPGYDFTAQELPHLVYWIEDAMADVSAGVRWDQDRWDHATVASILADMPCPSCAVDLRELQAAGRVPAGLQDRVREALAAMEAAA